MTSDEIEVAKLAAVVSQQLSKVDQSHIDHGTNRANQINPRNFVHNGQPNRTRHTNSSTRSSTRSIPSIDRMMITAPKSTPLAPEILDSGNNGCPPEFMPPLNIPQDIQPPLIEHAPIPIPTIPTPIGASIDMIEINRKLDTILREIKTLKGLLKK